MIKHLIIMLAFVAALSAQKIVPDPMRGFGWKGGTAGPTGPTGPTGPSGFPVPTAQAVTSGVTTSVVIPLNGTLTDKSQASPVCVTSAGVYTLAWTSVTNTTTQMTVDFSGTTTAGFTGTCTAVPSLGPVGPTGPAGPTGASGQGSVIAYTANHTSDSGDCGNWLTFSGATLTLTLASPPPSSTCQFAVQNISSSQALTISRNSLTINGVASNITIAACSGVSCQSYAIWTNGTNYFASAGPIGSGVFTPPYVTSDNVSFFGPIFSVTPPSASGWAWGNQGTSTVTAVNTSLAFSFQTNSGTDNLRCYTRSLPASTGYTAILGISMIGKVTGIGISDGTKYIVAYYSNPNNLILQKWDSTASFNGSYASTFQYSTMSAPLNWLRFQDVGGARTISISADGQNWNIIDSQASATFLTETTFGICQETNVAGSQRQTAAIVDLRSSVP